MFTGAYSQFVAHYNSIKANTGARAVGRILLQKKKKASEKSCGTDRCIHLQPRHSACNDLIPARVDHNKLRVDISILLINRGHQGLEQPCCNSIGTNSIWTPGVSHRPQESHLTGGTLWRLPADEPRPLPTQPRTQSQAWSGQTGMSCRDIPENMKWFWSAL